jgi:hypothetical protein
MVRAFVITVVNTVPKYLQIVLCDYICNICNLELTNYGKTPEIFREKTENYIYNYKIYETAPDSKSNYTTPHL